MLKHPFSPMLLGLVLLSLPVFLSGCGGGGSSSSSAGTPTNGGTGTIPDPALQASVTKSDDFTFTLIIDKNDISVGQSVTVKTVLSNTTKKTLYGEFAGDAYYLPTLDPILFKDTIVRDSQQHGINEDGSLSTPYTVLLNVPVTLSPGQSISSTRVYTFTRADTYIAYPGLKDHFVDGFTQAGPLKIVVH